MSLRRRTIEQQASLPDGREITVRLGIEEDSYLRKRDLHTVGVDLVSDGVVIATVNTLLTPGQEREARELAREIVEGLESGDLEPTASGIEPLADSIP